MTRFNTLEQVKKEFLLKSRGGDKLPRHSVRFNDLQKYGTIVEDLLESDYNKVSGFSFSELMEAISLVDTNCSSDDYLKAMRNDSKAMKVNESAITGTEGEYNFWSVNEALDPSTTAQAPYPVPSLALTTWQYTKAVIPYLAHQFDLGGNRGLVYYMQVNAANSKGNIQDKDLLGSPKDMSKQPLAFAGTQNVTKEEVASLVSGQTTYTYTLKNVPVQPGSLVLNVEGEAGYFKDIATGDADTVALLSVDGNLGTATLVRSTGVINITLATAPASSTGKIYATYRRDIETVDGGKANMARVQFKLDSKQLEAEDFSIFTETSVYQEALSKAIFGLDWNNQIDEGLAALYNKEVANKITAEIKAAIPASSIKTHSLNKTTGGNNDLFNVQFLSVIIGQLGTLITQASGIGNKKIMAIAVNIDVLPLLRALPKFTEANNDYEELMGGMYLAGLYDGMPVIVGFDPILTSGEIVGIYKSKSKDFLTPYVWGTFILPIIRDIFDQDNLAVGRKQLISSAAGEVVAEKLASKITITDIDSVLA